MFQRLDNPAQYAVIVVGCNLSRALSKAGSASAMVKGPERHFLVSDL